MTNSSQERDLRDLKGVAATVNLTGLVTSETMQCAADMRAHNITQGFDNVEYIVANAQLVESGRDSVLHHAKQQGYDFCLQYDGDAVFPADTMIRLLHTAFVEAPDSDVVGAYAQLKNPPFLPVIDTGTGTWEPHFPNEGILPVIRTGGHCLLIKSSAWNRFGPPWFRTRKTLRPVDAFAEVDNYARIKLDGTNPFASSDEWRHLMDTASEERGGVSSDVGEDSGFCDALVAAGGRIYVDSLLVTGHVAKKTIGPNDLRSAMRDRERSLRLSVGVME